jgi:hypothetical protein
VNSIRHMLYLWIAIAALLLGSPAVLAMNPVADDARPAPALAVDDVVKIQLEALRHNDAQDRGIAVAFRFASPSNQLNTGPLPRFARMLKDGPYALMLRFTHASYDPPQIVDREAVQRVTVVASGSAALTFIFYLSRQSAPGPLHNCWMTDAVQIEPIPGTQARSRSHNDEA